MLVDYNGLSTVKTTKRALPQDVDYAGQKPQQIHPPYQRVDCHRAVPNSYTDRFTKYC